MSQCIDAVQGCESATTWGPELISVEVRGQCLFLHGFDQFSELGTRFQPFGDAQDVEEPEAIDGIET